MPVTGSLEPSKMKPANFPMFLLVNLLAALLAGYLLDSWLNTSPIFIIIGLLYAIIGSFVILLFKGRKKHG
jgi:LPXTG-motif cell wall-anchored protein